MASAIMDGLAVATVLTLVFLPALYVTCFRIETPQFAASEKMDFAQNRRGSAPDLKRGLPVHLPTTRWRDKDLSWIKLLRRE